MSLHDRVHLNDKGQLHREDGPAYEGNEGSKSWYLNGLLHREDGPAVEGADGSKFWYLNDKLHRIDGPAYEGADGYKSWRINGIEYSEEEFNKKVAEMNKNKPTEIDLSGNKFWKNEKGELHREDGPAIEFASGDKCWYFNGKWHREDGPAIEYTDGDKHWYLNGQKYSEEEFNKKVAKINKSEDKDKPTKIDKFGNKYWHNEKGKLHREDGPAKEHADGYKAWYLNGKLHRIDGPAIEYADGDKTWCINGKRHRIDGPAYEGADEYKSWWINGIEYSEAEFNKKIAKMNKDEDKDKPTEIDLSKNKIWKNDKGERHREDGPAIEWYDGTKSWYLNGFLHREDGPAIEGPNGFKAWFVDGIKYTEEEFNKKIAKMKKDEDRDKLIKIDKFGNKYWYNDKKQYHREDGPAVEWADGTKWWYLNGKEHRIDGPAIEDPDGTKYWWINGEYYSEENFHKKVAEMNINYEDELNSLKKRLEQLEKIIKEKDKIIEDKINQTSIPKEETLSKKIQPTTELLSNVGINSMKLVGARQTSRALVGLVRFMLITIANKMGQSNYIEFIDSEPGKVMLEILAPLVIHSLSANKFFPKYTEQIEAVSKLSVEANITYYSLHYSDKISDLGTEILSNKETREQIKNLINLGSNIIGSEKDVNLSFQHDLDKIMA